MKNRYDDGITAQLSHCFQSYLCMSEKSDFFIIQHIPVIDKTFNPFVI